MKAYKSAHHTLSWADFWYVPQREVLEGGPGGLQGDRGGGVGAESTVQRGGSAGGLSANPQGHSLGPGDSRLVTWLLGACSAEDPEFDPQANAQPLFLILNTNEKIPTSQRHEKHSVICKVLYK